MDQISPPFRIALVALLAVCALWFTVLKPKDPAADTAPLPAAPGTTGLAKDVNAANGAVATSDAANAKVQAANGGTAATTKPKATGAPAAVAGKNATAKADAAAPLLSALARKHAVVLLFYTSRGSDDRAVVRAVRATDRHHGRVVVKTAPIAKVGRYESITRGARVLEAPTVLVIGPDHKARAVTGFTTTRELDQVVSDALAAAK